VREHHALGVGRRPARELEDRQAVGVVVGPLPRARQGAAGTGLHGLPADHRRIAGLGFDERRQVGIDEEERHVGVRDPDAGLVDELLDRREPHRQRKHDRGGAAEPDRLDGRGEGSRGGAEEADVVPRCDAERLEVRGVGARLLVELAVGDGGRFAADDEGQVVAAVSSGLDPLGQGQHNGSDR
jgi:hypothetical protein